VIERVLLVGAGGIGAPAAIALAAAGVRRIEVADDDRVELSNLHRQILFADADVGRPKLDAFADALKKRAPDLEVVLHRTRMLPDTARDLLRAPCVVLDATDNFATRFLIADAARIVGRPVVHAAAVRWQATVMASAPEGRPCYRCLFEDLPQGPAPDCATAGVIGPVCVKGDSSAFGAITTYDGRRDILRRVPVHARAACALCGGAPSVTDIDERRYLAASTAL